MYPEPKQLAQVAPTPEQKSELPLEPPELEPPELEPLPELPDDEQVLVGSVLS